MNKQNTHSLLMVRQIGTTLENTSEESSKVKHVDTVNHTKICACVHQMMCTRMFTASLFIIVPNKGNKKVNVHQPQNGYLNCDVFIMTEYHTAMK